MTPELRAELAVAMSDDHADAQWLAERLDTIAPIIDAAIKDAERGARVSWGEDRKAARRDALLAAAHDLHALAHRGSSDPADLTYRAASHWLRARANKGNTGE